MTDKAVKLHLLQVSTGNLTETKNTKGIILKLHKSILIIGEKLINPGTYIKQADSLPIKTSIFWLSSSSWSLNT